MSNNSGLKESGAHERLHALDAVRGGALLLGVVFHGTLSFLTSPFWLIVDNHRSVTLNIFFYVLHIFRMTVFFTIAGLFARMSFSKRGTKSFAKDRMLRIGVPLLIGWPFLYALLFAAGIWAAFTMVGPGALTEPNLPAIDLPNFPLAHLWFLYLLILFYPIALVCRSVVKKLDSKDRLLGIADRFFGVILRSRMSPFIVALPLGLTFWMTPGWLYWFGIVTPDTSLIPNLQSIVGYGVAFTFGWFLNRQMNLLSFWERRWRMYFSIALALTVICLYFAGLQPSFSPMGQSETRFVYSICFSAAMWAWTFAFIGVALRFLSAYSKHRRYVADASYWIYLIHLPLVLTAQVAVSRLDWPWAVKYSLVLLVVLALSFVSYEYLIRYSFVGAVLNGRRHRVSDEAVN